MALIKLISLNNDDLKKTEDKINELNVPFLLRKLMTN